MWNVLHAGDGELRVAPGLFRSIAHMTDDAWVMRSASEFSWRTIDAVCGLAGWTTTGIAGTTIPGTAGAWRHDVLTGQQPWNTQAAR
jgi:hypothetical protein